jgi:hypothetical protein
MVLDGKSQYGGVVTHRFKQSANALRITHSVVALALALAAAVAAHKNIHT